MIQKMFNLKKDIYQEYSSCNCCIQNQCVSFYIHVELCKTSPLDTQLSPFCTVIKKEKRKLFFFYTIFYYLHCLNHLERFYWIYLLVLQSLVKQIFINQVLNGLHICNCFGKNLNTENKSIWIFWFELL